MEILFSVGGESGLEKRIGGAGTFKDGRATAFNLLYSSLNEEQRKIYDDFDGLCGDYLEVKIGGAPYGVSGMIVRDESVSLEKRELNYDTMNDEDKSVVDKFGTLVALDYPTLFAQKAREDAEFRKSVIERFQKGLSISEM